MNTSTTATLKLEAEKQSQPGSSAGADAMNDPVQALKRRLQPIVMSSDFQESEWENVLYALITVKEPKTELHVILSALPYRHNMLDRLDMLNAMANLGYFSSPFADNLEHIDPRIYPCVLEPKSEKDDILILLSRDAEGWRVYNASLGKYEVIAFGSPLASKRYACYMFKPYDDTKTVMSRFFRDMTGHSWFMSVLSRFKGTFYQIFLIGFVLNLFSLTPPIFIMMIYDRVLSAQAADTLVMLSMGMFLALSVEWILRQLRSRSLSWLTARLDNIVGNKIFGHMLNLTPHHIEGASVTGQIARIRTFESARDFFSGGVFLSAIELPFTILSLFLIYYLAGPLVIVPACAAAIMGIMFFVLRRVQMLQIRKSARSSTIRQQFVLETLENIATIKANGMFDLWYQKFRQLAGRDATAHFRMQWLGSLAGTLVQAFSMIALVALIWHGTHLIWSGDISTGGMVAAMILIWRVLGPFQSLCLSIPRVEQLRSSVRQVNQIMELESEEVTARRVSKLPAMRGALTLENVSMKYSETGDLIYKDLSFHLEPGESLSITGPAGTGKSTLFKIIQGMYGINSGYVRIDGFDIRQLDVRDIRRQVSYLPQTHEFYQGSIIDNIRVGNPLATYEDIKRSLDFSGALEDVMALPDGLETQLHGGNKEYMSPSFGFQLALARMHAQDAPIILIDELPNQFQDGDIGNLLYRSIDRLHGKRTLLFVTFRKDYMALSDNILTLNPDKTSKFEPLDVLFQ